MNIQAYPKELNWVNATIDEGCGSFLYHFCAACIYADPQNYETLRPIVETFMTKYPVRLDRLMAEERDTPQ